MNSTPKPTNRFCNHATCQKIRNHRTSRSMKPESGVSILIQNHYYDRKTGRYTWVNLLGLERSGSYQGTYSLCSGKMDYEDHGCFLKVAQRELQEEIKLDLPFKSEIRGKYYKYTFDSVFTFKIGTKTKFRIKMYNGCPIFIGVVKSLSRNHLNPKIQRANYNYRLPSCQREIECVDWFRMSDGLQLEGKRLRVSSFARNVIKSIDIKNLNTYHL